QTVVIRQMVRDLNFNLQLVICPIVREPDGLAMSSRNAYLSPAQRRAAPVLHRALSAAKTAVERGERNGDALRRLLQKTVAAEPPARIDYVSVADPLTLLELATVEETALASMAVFFGTTRLIDNMLLEPASSPSDG
ncbi:MAG: pantoate--beta-alanine ligase, partial [Anaerolineae bacterium]